MDSQVKCPTVFDYLDALAYLQDYYQFRKDKDKNFSYQYWSIELEFNSRSFLRMIITGKKKITPKFTESFIRLNFSKKIEEDYFQHLVKYTQASNQQEKQLHSNKMIQILRLQNSAQMIEKNEKFTLDPALPRLLTLLSFTDIQATTELCAKIMALDIEVVRSLLLQLQEMKLAEQDVDGRWTSTVSVFRVPDSYGSVDVMKFHEKSLLEAIAAFEQPQNQRRYKSILLPMDEEGLKEFNRRLDGFSSDQMSYFNSKTCSGKRIFQVNFNLYGVTELIRADM